MSARRPQSRLSGSKLIIIAPPRIGVLHLLLKIVNEYRAEDDMPLEIGVARSRFSAEIGQELFDGAHDLGVFALNVQLLDKEDVE